MDGDFGQDHLQIHSNSTATSRVLHWLTGVWGGYEAAHFYQAAGRKRLAALNRVDANGGGLSAE